MEIPIDSNPQTPDPILDIPNTVTVPNPNKNYFKPLFFLFLGLFLVTVITIIYLLFKTS